MFFTWCHMRTERPILKEQPGKTHKNVFRSLFEEICNIHCEGCQMSHKIKIKHWFVSHIVNILFYFQYMSRFNCVNFVSSTLMNLQINWRTHLSLMLWKSNSIESHWTIFIIIVFKFSSIVNKHNRFDEVSESLWSVCRTQLAALIGNSV